MAAQDEIQTQRATIVLEAGEGEALWFNNDRLTLKATGVQTDGEFLLVEELATRGKATPLHSHPAEAETFYILEGQALFHIDGEECLLGTGDFTSVPPEVPHAYRITSERARTLILITPGGGSMEAFFRDAGGPAAEEGLPPAGPLDIERISAAAERTGAVRILGPPPFES